jgi:hypothetical protein
MHTEVRRTIPAFPRLCSPYSATYRCSRCCTDLSELLIVLATATPRINAVSRFSNIPLSVIGQKNFKLSHTF